MTRIKLTEEEAAELELLQKGGPQAYGEFFERHRKQLKTVVRFRLDPRLKRRVSESDIIQETSIKYVNEIDQYLVDPNMPPKVWLRRLARLIIWRVNRHHFETEARDVRREREVDSPSCTNIHYLAESLSSSAGKKIDRKHIQKRMRQLVAKMPKLEREILTMVHFEEQTIREAAIELGINYEAAKKRYLRALQRLKKANEAALEQFVS